MHPAVDPLLDSVISPADRNASATDRDHVVPGEDVFSPGNENVARGSDDRASRVAAPLLPVLAAAAAGIVADRWLRLPAPLWWSLAVVAWLAWLVAVGRLRGAAVVLLLAVAATAAAWHHVRWHLFPAHEVGRSARVEPQPVCVEATALDRPHAVPAPRPDPLRSIDLPDRTRLAVRLTRLRDGRAWRSVAGRATLLVHGHLLGIRPGDRLQVFAELTRPIEVQNPGQFDFARHARGQRSLGVLRAVSPDCVTVVERPRTLGVRRLIGTLRSAGDRMLARYVDPRYEGLAAAVLLGDRGRAGSDRTETFITTGTVHLLVVSGLHVSILAGGLMLLLRLANVPRKTRLILLATLVVLYAVLTGGRPPVVRATVLVVIFCLARYCGRQPLSFNSLAAAGLVVLALNPAELFRSGAQLSFLAVATLMLIAPLRWRRETRDPLDKLLAESRPWPRRVAAGAADWYVRLTLASLAVWLAALPLVMARFHLVSPAAVLLSPLLWPLLTVSLLAGFALLVAGWLVPPLGAVAGMLCNASLGLLQATVDVAERMPGSHFWVPGPGAWELIAFYAALGLLATIWPRRPCRALFVAAALLALCWGGRAVATRVAGDPPLRATFVAVDHGCAVLLELPGGERVLYDAGRLGSPHPGVRAISAALWSRGVRRLDGVVLSHADCDHYNTLPELLERFGVRRVFVGPGMFRDAPRVPALAALRAAIEQAGIPLQTIERGERLPLGAGRSSLEVLYPSAADLAAAPDGVADNARSVVLAVEHAGRRLLLPGDLEGDGLERLLAAPPLDCDVALAPHHGSPHSDPDRFAAWCRPEWIVASGGHSVALEATCAVCQARGTRLLHTARDGAVEVTLSAAGIDVQTYGPHGWQPVPPAPPVDPR